MRGGFLSTGISRSICVQAELRVLQFFEEAGIGKLGRGFSKSYHTNLSLSLSLVGTQIETPVTPRPFGVWVVS